MWCVAPAFSATPSEFQTGSLGALASTANRTLTFGSTPGNGDIMSVIVSANVSSGPSGVQDSNSVSLTKQKTVSNSGGGIDSTIYDYTITGSPTAAYTCVNSGTSGSCYAVGGIEMETAATNSYGSTSGSSSAPSLSITPAAIGDIIVCDVTTGGTAEASISLSNTSGVSYITNISHVYIGYGTVNASGAVACTAPTSATNWIATIADYTAAAASGSASPCPPYSYPCPFRVSERMWNLPDLWLFVPAWSLV